MNVEPWPKPALSAQMAAAESLHDPLADREAEAGVRGLPFRALAYVPGELTEQQRHFVGGHASAFVGHGHFDAVVPQRCVDRMEDDSWEYRAAFDSRLPSTWTMRRRSAITLGRSSSISMVRFLRPPPVRKVFLASSTGLPPPRVRESPTTCPSRCGPRPAGR